MPRLSTVNVHAAATLLNDAAGRDVVTRINYDVTGRNYTLYTVYFGDGARSITVKGAHAAVDVITAARYALGL